MPKEPEFIPTDTPISLTRPDDSNSTFMSAEKTEMYVPGPEAQLVECIESNLIAVLDRPSNTIRPAMAVTYTGVNKVSGKLATNEYIFFFEELDALKKMFDIGLTEMAAVADRFENNPGEVKFFKAEQDQQDQES